MAEPAKQTPCACAGFTEAVHTAFIENVDDEFFLASREYGAVGRMHSLIYGPKISFCPFCGASLDKPAST